MEPKSPQGGDGGVGQGDEGGGAAKKITATNTGLLQIKEMFSSPEVPLPDQLKARYDALVSEFQSIMADVGKALQGASGQQPEAPETKAAPPRAPSGSGAGPVPTNQQPLSGGAGAVPRM